MTFAFFECRCCEFEPPPSECVDEFLKCSQDDPGPVIIRAPTPCPEPPILCNGTGPDTGCDTPRCTKPLTINAGSFTLTRRPIGNGTCECGFGIPAVTKTIMGDGGIPIGDECRDGCDCSALWSFPNSLQSFDPGDCGCGYTDCVYMSGSGIFCPRTQYGPCHGCQCLDGFGGFEPKPGPWPEDGAVYYLAIVVTYERNCDPGGPPPSIDYIRSFYTKPWGDGCMTGTYTHLCDMADCYCGPCNGFPAGDRRYRAWTPATERPGLDTSFIQYQPSPTVTVL